MPTHFETFKRLHKGSDILVLPNAWDVKSALVFQENKFPAVATSSAAVANSLGYADGEDMPFADYLFVIKRIVSSINIPLTVDMEMGYGKTNAEIGANIRLLVAAGVTGINIEDSTISNGTRALKDAGQFAETIRFIRKQLSAEQQELFINVRCDTYILDVSDKHEETKQRIQLYEAAGADAIFLPFINKAEDIAAAVANTGLPINVMCMAGLPDFDTLYKLGVKRVSMGPFIFRNTYSITEKLSKQIITDRNFSSLFS